MPRYNIAPSQQALAILQGKDGQRQGHMLRWGLIPFWAKEPGIGSKMINARAETLAQRPSFRQAFRERRCVIPASGFYEWQARNGKKQPFYFRLRSKLPLSLAGLWEEWLSPQGPLRTFAIITTEANATVGSVHKRMPVILSPEGTDQWLDHSDTNLSTLQELLFPRPTPELVGYRVSLLVNSPANDSPLCVQPLESDE